jgi:hypothetical protein
MPNYMQGRNAAAPQDPNSRRPPLKREGAGAPTNVHQNEGERRQTTLQRVRERIAAKRPQ